MRSMQIIFQLGHWIFHRMLSLGVTHKLPWQIFSLFYPAPLPGWQFYLGNLCPSTHLCILQTSAFYHAYPRAVPQLQDTFEAETSLENLKFYEPNSPCLSTWFLNDPFRKYLSIIKNVENYQCVY